LKKGGDVDKRPYELEVKGREAIVGKRTGMGEKAIMSY